jgi:glutamate---cysteine ligase / carboxylate-amine ligase
VEHRFGSGQPFTVGIEEELLLVDSRTHALAPVAAAVLAAMDLPATAAAHEAYAAEVELRSPPSLDAAAGAAALAALRATAGAAGATLMGTGIHPAAELGDAELVDADRYRLVEGEMRGLIRRTPECALHVHVGMPDAETAIKVFNGLRMHVPLLAGLAANSPFWFGRDSGLASARAALVRAYPGRGIPPAWRDFDDYATGVAAMCAAGGLADYTLLWWDVRPHPRLGTVELRELDAQSSLTDVMAISALVQALARDLAESPAVDLPSTEAIAWSSFRAARDGVDARILHGGRLVPLPEVARDVVARVAPHAREAGSEAALESVERILRGGGGAARQRAAFARDGMAGLLGQLVEWTAPTSGTRGDRSP